MITPAIQRAADAAETGQALRAVTRLADAFRPRLDCLKRRKTIMTKHWHGLWLSGVSGCLVALACSSGGSSRDTGGTASAAAGPTGGTTSSTSGGGATATVTNSATTMGAAVTSGGDTTGSTTATATSTGASGTTTGMGGAAAATTTDASTTTSVGGGSSVGGSSTIGGAGGTTTTLGDCSSLPICEDFEGGTPGAEATIGAFTARTEGSGSVVFDSDAHGGSLSVLAQGQMAYLVNSDVVMAASGVLYVRAWMKLGEEVSSNHVGYITLSGGINMETDEMRFGGQNGQLHFNESAGDGLAPDPFEYPECTECVTLTPNQWTCVEVMFDYQNQVATAWVGDESFTADEASDFHSGTVTWPATPSEIKIGFRAWGGENTVWYDDVAVAYDRIGCE